MNITAAFPSKYVRAADLDGCAVSVVIDRVAIEKVGRFQKAAAVIYFQRAVKGLILNKTNAMAIAGLYGEETDAWAGKAIELYLTPVDFQGSKVTGIRVRKPVNGRK